MFNKDFAENDIWQHFDAVKNGRVYDLTYEYFGMSATFKYPQALEELQPILYPESFTLFCQTIKIRISRYIIGR